jgi:NitT/TauT family transport system permease protein
MLLRRIYQFFIIYLLGIALLFALKYTLRLSDYVIPSPDEIWRTGRDYAGPYLLAVLNTLAVAILGHLLSICLAAAVAVLGRLTAWIGSFIRTAAYNIQAYPIVAVAPIIFILQVKIRAFENIHKLTTVIVGSATMAMVGTIVAEFIAATAGIGYSIRIALYQSDLAKILVALFLIGIGTSLYLVSLEGLGNALQARLKRI